MHLRNLKEVMKSYNFLQDEDKLSSFLTLLPETTEDECYLIYLLGRSKYLNPDEKEHYNLGQKAVLLRKIATTKSKVKRKVLELCVPKGSFIDRDGKVLPEHCLAVYISLQPRSHTKASVQLIKDLTDHLHQQTQPRLDMAVFTQLQKHASRKHLLDIDIDVDKSEHTRVLRQVQQIMGRTPLHVLRTRGGSHVFVEKDKIDVGVKKHFYKALLKLNEQFEGEVGIDNDSLVPLAGCYQGGFMPYLDDKPYLDNESRKT